MLIYHSDFCPYLELKELLSSTTALDRRRFRILFTHYYGLNTGGMTAEFKDRFFDIFFGGLIGENGRPDFDYLLTELNKIKGRKLMSQKKSLQEQGEALLTGRANWLEPLQNWILTAKNAGKIAVSGSPQEKKALAKQVFGSNLVLDCKKARGYCLKPWSLLVENSSCKAPAILSGIGEFQVPKQKDKEVAHPFGGCAKIAV